MSFGDFRDARNSRLVKSRAEIVAIHRAQKTFEEIVACELFIAFTDLENHTREASYCEFGMALRGLKQNTWIVGPRVHCLHWYPDVSVFATMEEMLAALAKLGRKSESGKKDEA